MDERNIAIKIEGLKKMYRLGVIGGGTLQGDIQSWWAKKRGKEDPNTKIGSKQYGKNETFMALDGIDLTVRKGERLGIIGHNGAGKSTLLKLLSRVTSPTEGKICIDGRISSMLEVGTGFNGELTGRENIYLNGAILGMTRAEVDSKIEQIIDFSECRQFIDTPVKRYSSGMYVKLAFAVAAHLDSEILIMDEVLAVGDVNFQQKCLKKMSNVSMDEGRTILYVSHNMSTIRQLCERCIVMDHGKIVFDGDVEEAISIYSKFDENNLKSEYDLSDIKRLGDYRSNCEFSKLILKKVQIELSEDLEFELIFNSLCKINNCMLRFVIFNRMGTPIGTAYSNMFNIKESGSKFMFKLSTISIMPGEYYVDLILVNYNNNIQTKMDMVNKCFYFRINEGGKIYNMQWLQSWGAIRLNDLSVIKEEDISEQ